METKKVEFEGEVYSSPADTSKQSNVSATKGDSFPDILGEFGEVQHPGGGVSTELSITVTDPMLNDGKPTNIPTLVKGNEALRDLILSGKFSDSSIDQKVEKTAIKRAIERQKEGMKWPSFSTIKEAVSAAEQRSQAKSNARQQVEFEGQTYEFPADTSDEEVLQFLDSSTPKYSETDLQQQFDSRLEKLEPGTYKFGDELIEVTQ